MVREECKGGREPECWMINCSPLEDDQGSARITGLLVRCLPQVVKHWQRTLCNPPKGVKTFQLASVQFHICYGRNSYNVWGNWVRRPFAPIVLAPVVHARHPRVEASRWVYQAGAALLLHIATHTAELGILQNWNWNTSRYSISHQQPMTSRQLHTSLLPFSNTQIHLQEPIFFFISIICSICSIIFSSPPFDQDAGSLLSMEGHFPLYHFKSWKCSHKSLLCLEA